VLHLRLLYNDNYFWEVGWLINDGIYICLLSVERQGHVRICSKLKIITNYFLAVLGLELGASWLWSRCYTTWVMSPAFVLWLFWRYRLDFCPGQPGPWSCYFTLPTVSVLTGVCHWAQLLVEVGESYELPSWTGLEPQSSPSQAPS
jgi:hypothetical protein